MKSKMHMHHKTYALVMANLLCFPEESKKTFALTTFSPRFLSAFICSSFTNSQRGTHLCKTINIDNAEPELNLEDQRFTIYSANAEDRQKWNQQVNGLIQYQEELQGDRQRLSPLWLHPGQNLGLLWLWESELYQCHHYFHPVYNSITTSNNQKENGNINCLNCTNTNQ